MREIVFCLVALLFSFSIIACTPQADKASDTEDFALWTGPYIGQEPPGDAPELFAPGIVTSGLNTRDVAITPDGNEIFFGLYLQNFKVSAIAHTEQIDGRWTKPEIAPFSGRYMDLEPCLSQDGKKLFFLSFRPKEEGGEAEGNEDIWVVERTESGWGTPYNIGPPINTDAGEFFPSVSRDGTLYFTRNDPQTRTNAIYRSRFVDGQYAEPEKLGPQINCGQNRFNAFIAPDESYCIVPALGMPDSIGSVDYYIVFRNADGSWSDPINMGDKVNTEGGLEYSPYVSPDRKYFFFMSTRSRFDKEVPEKPLTLKEIFEINNAPEHGNTSIYWIDASFIEALRPQ